MKFSIVISIALLIGTWPSVSVDAFRHEPDRLFDYYGRIRWNDEKARLDNFAITLQHDEKLIGYIFVYDSVGGCPGEALARAIRAKRYIVEHRGVPWNRVIWRYEGFYTDFTTILQPAPREIKLSNPIFPTVEGKPGPLTKSCRMKIRQIRRSPW